MSPRKNNVLVVKGWSNPKRGKLYKGIVREAKKNTQNIHVLIENLDPAQLGRTHEINLPLPIRPSKYHKTCSFLMACGIDASNDGANVDINNVIGVTIGMRFGAIADESQQIEFEKIENPQI
jgi:hypothetical protein